MTKLYLSSKTIELLERLFPQEYTHTPEVISFNNLLNDAACFTIQKVKGKYVVCLNNKTINFQSTLFASASIQLTISYVHFLKTKAVSPLYLAVPSPHHTPLKFPKRFRCQGIISNLGNYNSISWFTVNNHLVIALFPQTPYNDFRVTNHMIEYTHYVEQILSHPTENDILEP